MAVLIYLEKHQLTLVGWGEARMFVGSWAVVGLNLTVASSQCYSRASKILLQSLAAPDLLRLRG